MRSRTRSFRLVRENCEPEMHSRAQSDHLPNAAEPPKSLSDHVLRGAGDRSVRDAWPAGKRRQKPEAPASKSEDGVTTAFTTIPDRIVFDFRPRAQIAVVCHVFYLTSLG